LLVQDVFTVREFAFDAVRLRDTMKRLLSECDVDVRTGAQASHLQSDESGALRVTFSEGSTVRVATGRHVYNCTYSRLNELLVNSGVAPIPLNHELAELALVEMPAPLHKIGLTMMCGPFFSVMPFPSAGGLHSFSHVRYTPHLAWVERGPEDVTRTEATLDAHAFESNFPRMVRDACRYMPALADVRYDRSLFEVKTILPSSEADDSRPILFKRGHGFPNLTCILGGKIDNIFDALAELDEQHMAGSVQ